MPRSPDRKAGEPRRYHGTFATHPDNDTRLQQVIGESKHLTVSNPLETGTNT